MPFVMRTDSAFVHALGTVPRQLGCIEETLGAAGFADVAIDRVDIWVPGARSVREEADLLSLIGARA